MFVQPILNANGNRLDRTKGDKIFIFFFLNERIKSNRSVNLEAIRKETAQEFVKKQKTRIVYQVTQNIENTQRKYSSVLDGNAGELNASKILAIIKKEKVNNVKPKVNVIFLITHKTGSLTVTNVLQRFAKSHHLKVALPKCDHRFCYPRKFETSFLYKPYFDNKYNMLFNHAVFHKKNMLSIMENNNAKIATIIREPFSQFDSTSDYFNIRKFYKLNNETPVMDAFFENSNEELKKTVLSFNPLNDTHGAFSLAKNPNSFDLGFDVWNESSEYIQSVIKSIKQDFHLVMIMEYMKESFVLLKIELFWNLEDVTFNVHNAREKKVKNTNDKEKIKNRVYSWNKLNAELYNFFNKIFCEKVKNAGNDFEIDVQKLKIMNKNIKERCSTESSKVSAETILKYLIMERENNIRNNFNKFGYVKCIEILANDIEFKKWFKIFF
nr:galactose-3-O-sulfotransferase 3-like [Hydra vulgaris]